MPHNRIVCIRVNENNNNNNEQPTIQQQAGDNDLSASKCCSPLGCHLNVQIHLDDLNDCVKVICNNEHCQEGRYMHKECFDLWEESVLTYLRSSGRARSWSEKQRLQNLWTKKGYDLAYKACGCKCNKGHLKKDLDWILPSGNGKEEQANSKKRKNRRKKSNDKPRLTINTTTNSGLNKNTANNNNTTNNGSNIQTGNPNTNIPANRLRTSSMSSSGSANSGGLTPPGIDTNSPEVLDNLKKFMFFNDNVKRDRHNSGSIFSKRIDFSSFNHLPKHKLNSYHIKMEDDHGSDETRCFLLSTFSANHLNRTSCIVCEGTMIIFDRLPLINGTFFLSPEQHHKCSVPVQMDNRLQYLNAICMDCMESYSATLRCKICKTKWDGTHLTLGSMYSYDIFAAVPCCPDRLRCNNCRSLVIPPEQRLQFFSDYSRLIRCTSCGTISNHFVKPLQLIYHRMQGE